MHMKKQWIGCLLCLLPMVLHANMRDNVRGTRYCEIIVSDGWLRCAVYTTEGVNNCPKAFWNNLTTKDAKAATGASKAILQGPRYWTMDKIQTTPLIQVEEKKFKRLKTKKIAYVHIGISDIFNGAKPYRRHQIDLKNIFTYKAGRPVYELVDPKGRVYIMQSYSVDKAKQTERSLSKLGSKLHLPKGWQFKTGVLKQKMVLKTVNNKAVVLHDDLMNRYQMSSRDFLR
ncbi:MAG: hypothetical protein P1U32_03715 [Legionellaceae bacterium]|nr:hypothetical protein [Legionellaceae bacterium]